MLAIGAGPFSRAMHLLGIVRGQFSLHVVMKGDAARDLAVGEGTRDISIQELQKLRAEVVALGAPVSLVSVDRLIRNLKDDKDFTQESAMILMESMETRIFDELASKNIFALSPKETSFFDGGDFGKDVISKFPSAAYDIDEAAKCLALSRATASVFHLMRVMEVALGALHKCLGITVALVGNDRNWGNILNRIRDNIKARGNFNEKLFFQELYALLDAVKDAWRNATMHVEDKKTEDEAEMIFITVRSFMKKLSSRMDESGVPLA